MKKIVVAAGLILLLIAVLALINKNAGNSLPGNQSDSGDLSNGGGDSGGAETAGSDSTDLPFRVPENLSISIFSEKLSGVRVMAFDRTGNLWVSRTAEGIVSLIRIFEGKAAEPVNIFENLKKPHGLVFDPADPNVLYIAEEDKISKVNVEEIISKKNNGPMDSGQLKKIAVLPAGGRHTTRTLLFLSDSRLLVSIGSSCDVCDEGDEKRAAIYSLNKDGSDFRPFAKGLRNSVFMALNPDSEVWATEMGRDFLGDDLPPDEINIIKEGANYGWPICYGKNIHDTDFDQKTYIRNPCSEPFEQPSFIDLPAHSAPLGLAFIPADGWPAELSGDLIVAFHGSWNRSKKTGYKIVRINTAPADKSQSPENGQPAIEEFITGWLNAAGQTFGRPADLKFGPDKRLYISDDARGVIYRVEYQDKKMSN